jgi:AraC-like DNA-binding protein
MENNLIIENLHTSYEGALNPGLIERNELRKNDGFCYFLKGSLTYYFKGLTLYVKEGDVIYIPKGGDYNFLVHEPSVFICIDFSLNKNGLSPYVFNNAKNVGSYFSKYLYNWLKPSPIRLPKAYEIINRIYCELINVKNKGYTNSYHIFSKAFEIIIKNYREQNFTVESLAKELNISEVHLRRIFINSTGVSPKKTINNIRFEQAKTLLETTNLPISEIALNIGFCDQFHFSKSFKEAVGISPIEYRKRL